MLHIKFEAKVTLFLLFCFFAAQLSADELRNLSPEQLLSIQKNHNPLIIDIRTEKEWAATGIIPNSHKLQFFAADGKFDTEKWLANLNQLKTSTDQSVILVCRSGNRSGIVGTMLTKQLGLKNIYHLSSGISHWMKNGNKVTKECSLQLACQ